MTVDMTSTEWVGDLSILRSSALGTRTTHSPRFTATDGSAGTTTTLVSAGGYVDYDTVESIHEALETLGQSWP